jgi:L-ascorbate metabolism protein UlaG (beta-lactamase superfamily)
MSEKSIKITLIGGPTVKVEFCGLRFLTDPTFDAGGSTYRVGAVVFEKKVSPAIPADAVGTIDAVLLSHDQHVDNLDISGREFLPKVGAVYTTPAGAKRLGGNAHGLSAWETVSVKSPGGAQVNITATPCRHGPAGIEPITGDVTGFMLEARDRRCGPVYITGDTVYYEGVAEVARRFSPSVILAFAGAARTRGPFDLTMSVNDLLDTAQAFPAALIIPVHSDGRKHYTQTVDDFTAAFRLLNIPHRIKILEPGETCAC